MEMIGLGKESRSRQAMWAGLAGAGALVLLLLLLVDDVPGGFGHGT